MRPDIDAGFVIVPAVFAASEVARILQELERAAVERSRAGARHLMSVPTVRDVARDSRLLSIARQFLDGSAIPFRATLFDKSPSNNWLVVWHQDTALPLKERCDSPAWGPWSMKGGIAYAHAPADALARVVALRLQLDDSHAENGPLRVLPGTHELGLLGDDEIARLSRDIVPVDCVAPAGSVVAMRPLLLHASSKALTDHPRRVLHIEYAQSIEMDPGLQLAIV